MKHSDGCPAWAEEMIDQLRQVEVFLGNVPKALAWQSDHVNQVLSKTFLEESVLDNDKADLIFHRITRRLHAESYSQEAIVGFFNSRIGYKGGPKYCSTDEVEAVLGSTS